MLARVGGFSARLLRPTWVGPLVFVALLAFAAWAVSLSVTVRGLRDDVERRVSWLRAVTEALADDDATQRADGLRAAFAAMATDESSVAKARRASKRDTRTTRGSRASHARCAVRRGASRPSSAIGGPSSRCSW
jgi:hypothetical protein